MSTKTNTKQKFQSAPVQHIEEKVIDEPIAKGMKVQIIGVGNTSAYGVGSQCHSSGKVRQVIDVIPFAEYPIKLGRYSGVDLILTGFYKEKDLRIIK